MKKLLASLAAAVTIDTAFAQTKWDLTSGCSPNSFEVQNLPTSLPTWTKQQ